jgi:hypothetical protein
MYMIFLNVSRPIRGKRAANYGDVGGICRVFREALFMSSGFSSVFGLLLPMMGENSR